MAKLEGIKWELESDDQLIKFDLTTNYSDVDGVASFGRVFFDGEKVCDAKVVLPDVFFKKQRKPRAGNKLLTYALLYYLWMFIVNTVERKNGNLKRKNSNKATGAAMEYLGLDDADRSIRIAREKYPIPGGAKIVVSADPLGIIVLLDEKNIELSNGELIYKGRMWAWREGSGEAINGYGELKI